MTDVVKKATTRKKAAQPSGRIVDKTGPEPTPGLNVMDDSDCRRLMEVVNTFGEYDSDVLVNKNTMASRYMNARIRLTDYCNRVLKDGSNHKVEIGLFVKDDMALRHEMGYRRLKTRHFENWDREKEFELGVKVEDGYLMIDNKFVCFIVEAVRKAWTKKWDDASNALGRNALAGAGVDKPIDQAEPGEIAAQVEVQEEVILRKAPQQQEGSP